MKKTIFLILTSVLLSTSFSYLLLKRAISQKVEVIQAASPQFVNYKSHPINLKPGEIGTAPSDFVTASTLATPSVVNITAFTDYNQRVSSGSGVIISSDGYIITNYHVVERNTEISVTLSDKRLFSAEVKGYDPTTDLALVKISARDLQHIRIGNSDDIQVGEWVLAVGNPFNLASTVTAGIVSAKGRDINILQGEYSIESFIQTDAVVNPGNSGGALVNTRGELVGINTAIISETGGFDGYSFAIPSKLVQKVIRDLKEYGTVQRAILGVRISNVNNSIAAALDLPSVEGVYISGITSGSSAAAAGLQSDDVIVGLNGKKVKSVSELQEQIARYRPGDRVSIQYIRNGRRYQKESVRLQKLN
ncbi:MAG: PDZ domain-containing protein [Bacteroidetes bacterium]|nr:PDZ domain-containing protein [Bacteroidota bacterium]